MKSLPESILKELFEPNFIEPYQHLLIHNLFFQLEAQLVELQLKSDEQSRQIQELTSWKSRAMNENGDLTR